MKHKKNKPKKILKTVLIIVAAVALLVAIYPYAPKIWYLLYKPKIDSAPYEQASSSNSPLPSEVSRPGNRLVLPQIGVNAQIYESESVNILDSHNGVWLDPATNNPTEPGNMVIAGHRFQYRPQISNFFYNLVEIKNGNVIYVVWDNKVYDYKVYDIQTIDPTQTDIRNNDPQIKHKLTLYTCTPLGSTSKRYVVMAAEII